MSDARLSAHAPPTRRETPPAGRRRAIVPLVAVLVAAGCGRPDAAATSTRTNPTSTTQPTEGAARADEAAAAHARAEAELAATDRARALVGRWLDAQNRGDFAAYEALYDETFHGVKRTPRAETTFDRRGWLADRRRMFGRPMTVSAEGIAATAADAALVVTFRQRFASGRYADEGQKRLLLVEGPSGLRIREEELLTPKRVSATEVELDAGVLLVTGLTDGRSYAVLGYAPPDLRGGPLHLLGAPSTRLDAARDVAPADAGVAAPLLTESLTVLTPDGACAARVVALRLVRGAEVMSPEDFVDGQPDPDDPRALVPDPAVVWDIGAQGGNYGPEPPRPPWLVAELAGTCVDEGLLAVRAGVAAPAHVPMVEPARSEGADFLRAYARAPSGLAVDVDGEGNPGLLAGVYLGTRRDTDPSGSGGLLGVDLLRIGRGPQQVTVMTEWHEHPCGDDPTVHVVVGEPPDVREPSAWLLGTPHVLGAFDLEHDGSPELVAWTDASTLALVRVGPRPGVLRSYHFSAQVCGC